MSRLIDADTLLDKFEWKEGSPLYIRAIRAMIEVAPSIDAVPQWIPCSERLPTEGEYVLLSNALFDSVAIGKLIRYNTSCCWEVDHWDYDFEDWKAWMPLPKPYKE